MADKIISGAEYLIREVDKDEVFTPEDFTEEQRQIADTTSQIAMNDILPRIREIDEQNFDLVLEFMRKCGELGLLMTDVPEAYGGLGLDKVTTMLVADRMAPCGSFSVSFSAHTGIGMLPIVYYGTPEQKEKYLEKLMSAEWISAYCLTEPESGSDAMGVRATAKLSDDGKHYILNGTKQFITNAGFANLFVVFVRIDGEHFSTFLVERDYEGVTIGPEEKKLGIKGSSTCPVILEDVKVPVENLLGEIGKGYKIALNILNFGRFKLGAAVTGAARHVLNVGVKYSNERYQFGVPISTFGAIQEKIANMIAEVFASESLIYRSAGHLDAKIATLDKDAEDYYDQYQKVIENFSVECAIAKVYCSEVLSDVADEVLQIHGGYGFTQEYDAERYYRDERINRIFEGTNEINRMLIPGTILKKGLKGELPIQKEAMKAFEALMTPSLEEIDEEELFAKEKLALKNLKQIFLILSGAAAQKYMEKLKDEQEILMAAADIAMEIYAIESALLRAEKIFDRVDDAKKELLKAVVLVYTFNGVETAASAAKRGAFYVEEGDTLKMILSGIRRYTKFDAEGLLKAKRLLAAAAIKAEKYIF